MFVSGGCSRRLVSRDGLSLAPVRAESAPVSGAAGQAEAHLPQVWSEYNAMALYYLFNRLSLCCLQLLSRQPLSIV
jgi:hypothetical protein